MDYTIKINPTDTMARQCIDMAVHHALERFKGDFGDNQELVYRIARDAAATAMEQFKAWCNAELRLIATDHDTRVRESMLRPLVVEIAKRTD